MIARIPLLVLFASATFLAMGQPPNGGTPVTKPAKLPREEINFSSVMSAKISADGSKLQVIAPTYQDVTQVREVTIPRLVPETRTRVVTDANGAKREETYEVNTTVMMKIPQTYTTKSIVGITKHEVKLEEARAWKLDGSALDAKALSDALKESTQVFIVEVFNEGKFEGIDPFYAAILKKDAIVIYLTKGILAESVVK